MVLFYLENVTFGFLSGNGLKTNFFMCFREVILTETEDNNVFKSHMSNRCYFEKRICPKKRKEENGTLLSRFCTYSITTGRKPLNFRTRLLQSSHVERKEICIILLFLFPTLKKGVKQYTTFQKNNSKFSYKPTYVKSLEPCTAL